MKTLQHTATLPVDANTAWDLFESEDFRTRLQARNGIAATVLDQRDEGGVQVTRMKYQTQTALPGPVAKLLGTKHLEYEQTNRFDRSAGTLSWTVNIPALGERVNVKGLTTIKDAAGGSTRTVDGSIEIKVRFIGGQIEGLVGGGFERSMGEAVDVVLGMISDRGLA